MKHLKRVFLLFVLFFLFIYVVSIDNIPQTIQIFQGEEVSIPTLWGVKISNKNETIETSSTLYSTTFNEIGEEKLEVSLFDKIRLKTINVNVIEDIDVIPVGEIVGIKLYTNGVMVVGMSSIEGEDGNIYKPYQELGIQEGDSITYINDTLVIYSLGNFLSAQDTNNDYNTTVGLLSSIKITKNIDKDNNSSIKLSDLNNELIYTTNKDGYKIIPFSNPDIKDYLNDYERVYNKYANIVRSIDSSININSLS